MRKKKIIWNIKTKCVTDFYWQLGLRAWRIILVITWGAHKRQMFTLISIKLMWILKFLFTRNRIFKHKGVVSKCMFVVMASGKCELHTYFTFCAKNSNLHTWTNLIFFSYYMSRFPTFTFQVSIMTKLLAQHISFLQNYY